ncbi:hypothetical protein KIN20_025953 [Parelaphostrongylus tenuis]|uniref:Uncharacterized protein n=1 Tax=Parelaphostrongylus tenuis TaxID=148309 RepID=A0AAD5QUT1_PARTN|nr:hypothetical protein KIN20_025953 [Parelaphostrongylus tenuis]
MTTTRLCVQRFYARHALITEAMLQRDHHRSTRCPDGAAETNMCLQKAAPCPLPSQWNSFVVHRMQWHGNIKCGQI